MERFRATLNTWKQSGQGEAQGSQYDDTPSAEMKTFNSLEEGNAAGLTPGERFLVKQPDGTTKMAEAY